MEILLITSDSSLTRLLKMYFQSRGVSIKSVPDCDHALKELDSAIKPLLILLDNTLLENFSFFKVLKEDEILKEIPAYFLKTEHSNDQESNEKKSDTLWRCG